MTRDPTNPADQMPDEAKDTEVDPSTTLPGPNKSTETGMTSEEYQAALDAIPGGYFYDTISDADGALSPGETVPRFSDLSPEDRKIMTKKFAKKRAERARTTVNLAPGEAIKLRDQITGNATSPTDPTDPSASNPGMTERQIRDQGWQADLLFESAGPGELRYSSDGDAEEWIPPPGWGEGLPGIDPELAEEMGVPEMSSGQMPDRSPAPSPGDQQAPPAEEEDAAEGVSGYLRRLWRSLRG